MFLKVLIFNASNHFNYMKKRAKKKQLLYLLYSKKLALGVNLKINLLTHKGLIVYDNFKRMF